MTRRKPTPIHSDPIDQHIAKMRTFLGFMGEALTARDCPGTRESIEEMEERGEVGCPLCGARAGLHRNESEEKVG